jgi:hypothetical protein
VPNIRPKPNIRWFFAAEYSVSAESENPCFGRTLISIFEAHNSEPEPVPNISTPQVSIFGIAQNAKRKTHNRTTANRTVARRPCQTASHPQLQPQNRRRFRFSSFCCSSFSILGSTECVCDQLSLESIDKTVCASISQCLGKRRGSRRRRRRSALRRMT